MTVYENIQSHCTDDSIRMWSKRLVCQHLHSKAHITGDKRYQVQSIEILQEMPKMIDSREYLSTILVLDFDEHLKACSEAIELELCLLENTVIHYCHYQDRFSPDYKIKLVEKLFKLYDTFITDGNYGKLWPNVIGNYAHLGLFYFQKNDEEKALKYFKLCAEEAKRYDTLPAITERTSQFFEGTTYEKPFLGKSMCERTKINMTKHYPLSDSFKERKEFRDIIALLEE